MEDTELAAEGAPQAAPQRAENSINVFLCPSRRGMAILYPYIHPNPYFNIDNSDALGRSTTAKSSTCSNL